MASESWFQNLRETSRNHSEKHLGVFTIEVAILMSRLVHLWNSLSDNQLLKLREAITNSVGIKKLVSDEDDYIRDLIATEMQKDLESVVKSVARFSKRCSDSLRKEFGHTFHAEDAPRKYTLISIWENIKRYVMSNEKKYRKMETLSDLEQILRRMKDNNKDEDTKKFVWSNKISVWSRSRDYIFLLLARSAFSTFRRFEHVFPKGETMNCRSDLHFCCERRISDHAPLGTLGGAALALRYASVIIAIEKLVSCPHLIGQDARDDLYNMLPTGVRISLRARLKPYAKSLGSSVYDARAKTFGSSVYDAALAGEWTEAISGILEWLSPLAHNMIRWQHEKRFEHLDLFRRTDVFLVQTLYYASQEKTEATITELLVGLNYMWRFGSESKRWRSEQRGLHIFDSEGFSN